MCRDMPRGHSGREVTDKQIIDVLRNSDEPFLFTGEVADEIEMTRQGAHRRLKELASDGETCVRAPKAGSGDWTIYSSILRSLTSGSGPLGIC